MRGFLKILIVLLYTYIHLLLNLACQVLNIITVNWELDKTFDKSIIFIAGTLKIIETYLATI